MMIYLAAPYYDLQPSIVDQRMEKIYEMVNDLMEAGDHVVTPLFMHEIAIRFNLPGTYEFWESYCLDLLKRCDIMYVLRLPGWDKSRGVAAEIKYCEDNHILITYVDP